MITVLFDYNENQIHPKANGDDLSLLNKLFCDFMGSIVRYGSFNWSFNNGSIFFFHAHVFFL